MSDEINSSIDYLLLAAQLREEVGYLLKSNYFAFRHLFKDFDDYKSWLKQNYGNKLPEKLKEYLNED
ncbi:MAG: hypothetical protein WCZ90_12810 [Melioribacteraceae bacterium]